MRWMLLTLLALGHGVFAAAPDRPQKTKGSQDNLIVVCQPVQAPAPFSQVKVDLFGIEKAAETSEMDVVIIKQECRAQNIAVSTHSQ